jgi:hypothetical protein
MQQGIVFRVLEVVLAGKDLIVFRVPICRLSRAGKRPKKPGVHRVLCKNTVFDLKVISR